MALHRLPESTPSAEGVAAEGVGQFLDAAANTPGVELHSLEILRHGKLISAGWWSPYAPDGVHLLYSLSKSFTATALGVAAATGLLSLEDPVVSYFPELDEEIRDPRSRQMLLRHLAAMSSGHREDTWEHVLRTDPDHPVRAFLKLPPEEEPGTVFAYNQSCPYTLATILQRVTGTTLTEYLRATVLDAIGVGDVAWTQQPDGQDQGFSGLHATTDAVARLGELYLRDGVWSGTRVLPAGWAATATRVHSATDAVADPAVGDKPDWKLGYGYQFWRSTHGYRADGAFGQFCLVLPEQDAVIATTGQNSDTQALLTLVWEELLPAFGHEPRRDTGADRRLQERMEGLELAPCAAESSPREVERSEGRRFSAAGGAPSDQPTLEHVSLHASASGWQAVLEDDGTEILAPLGSRWQRAFVDGETAPIYSSGGWLDEETVRVELLFAETPHRLIIECALADGSFAASWVAAPRRTSPLRTMRAPAASRQAKAATG